MRIFLVIAALNIFIARAKADADCPMIPGNTRLDFSQVMYNLGKYTSKADKVIRSRAEFLGTISNDDLVLAVDSLNIAIACADRVLAKFPVLPAKTERMLSAERDVYIEKLQDFMRRYRDLLIKYELAVEKLTPTSPTEDFALAEILGRRAWKLAGESHDHL